jgi:hypothetical protein
MLFDRQRFVQDGDLNLTGTAVSTVAALHREIQCATQELQEANRARRPSRPGTSNEPYFESATSARPIQVIDSHDS